MYFALSVMAIQGMELFAVAVVILMFVLVLKQFGITEPLGDGKILVLTLVYCLNGHLCSRCLYVSI